MTITPEFVLAFEEKLAEMVGGQYLPKGVAIQAKIIRSPKSTPQRKAEAHKWLALIRWEQKPNGSFGITKERAADEKAMDDQIRRIRAWQKAHPGEGVPKGPLTQGLSGSIAAILGVSRAAAQARLQKKAFLLRGARLAREAAEVPLVGPSLFVPRSAWKTPEQLKAWESGLRSSLDAWGAQRAASVADRLPVLRKAVAGTSGEAVLGKILSNPDVGVLSSVLGYLPPLTIVPGAQPTLMSLLLASKKRILGL